MVWLDGLDLPTFRHFPVHFVEHFDQPRYPAVDIDSKTSPLVFPWVEMKERLDAEEGEWAALRYLKKDGREGKFGVSPPPPFFSFTLVHALQYNVAIRYIAQFPLYPILIAIHGLTTS